MTNEELYKIKDIDPAAIQYMNSIKSYTPLGKDEEHKLIIDYKKKNDINSRNKLINSNLKYTCKLASNYRNKGIPFSVLISEANEALLYAVDLFNEKNDVKLISYARWWINQRVSSLVNNNDFDFDELPTEHESQMDENNDFNVEQNISDEYSNNAFYADEDEEKRRDDNELLGYLYKFLNKRERDCLDMYYGRAPYEKSFNLEEIGKKYKITRERARQIIEKSITKMRSEAMLMDRKSI